MLAIRDYTSAISLVSSSSKIFVCRGAVYADIGMMSEALTDFEDALIIHPKCILGFYNKALVLHSLGMWSKALENYTKGNR